MFERNLLALLALVLGTFGLVAGLGEAPADLPTWVWVSGVMAPFVAMYIGSSVEEESERPGVVSGARWVQVAGALAFVGLWLSAAAHVLTGAAPVWALALAAVGLWPATSVLLGVARRRGGIPEPTTHLGILANQAIDGAPPNTLAEVLRVVGPESLGMGLLGALFVAAGAFVLFVSDDPADQRLGLVTILLFGACVPLAAHQGLTRWYTVAAPGRRAPAAWGAAAWVSGSAGLWLEALGMTGHPLWLRILCGLAGALMVLGGAGWLLGWRRRGGAAGRVWIAREGLVEEGHGAVILFPWEHLVGFELVEQHGRPSVRVWLNEEAHPAFFFLDTGLDDEARAAWSERRQRGLRTSRALTGAPLWVGDAGGSTPGEVYRTLVRVARDPETADLLPSVLDDPPPIDLGPPPSRPG